jgi:hypothetical protein
MRFIYYKHSIPLPQNPLRQFPMDIGAAIAKAKANNALA